MWIDELSTGVSGYKIEVKLGGGWKELLRGTDPTQRSFAIPQQYADSAFRVRAYTASRGNGDYTSSANFINPPVNVISPSPTPAAISVNPPAKVINSFIKPVNLGNPFKGKRAVYARNVWDMQTYKGQIYLGHGDSSANSGNTPIWSLDPQTEKFTNQFLTTSEQVDEFFPIGDKLYTLDHDPTGAENGNLYCTEGGPWCAEGQISSMGHAYGLTSYRDKLWVAGASRSDWSVWNGENRAWKGVLTGKWQMEIMGRVYDYSGQRTWMMLPVKGELYAMQEWRADAPAAFTGFYRWNAKTGGFERSGATGAVLAAGVVSQGVLRYKRLVTLDDGSVLTLLVEGVNDHQWNPLRLMWVRGIKAGEIAALALPGGAKPYDIVRRGALIYVCAWDAAKKQNVVFSLDADKVNAKPTEVLRFDAPSFARSFEESEGNFYFGLGCDQSPTPAQTGEIWKVSV